MINYSRKASGYGVGVVQLSNSSIPCSSPFGRGVVARYVSVCDTWGLINMDEAKGLSGGELRYCSRNGVGLFSSCLVWSIGWDGRDPGELKVIRSHLEVTEPEVIRKIEGFSEDTEWLNAAKCNQEKKIPLKGIWKYYFLQKLFLSKKEKRSFLLRTSIQFLMLGRMKAFANQKVPLRRETSFSGSYFSASDLFRNETIKWRKKRPSRTYGTGSHPVRLSEDTEWLDAAKCNQEKKIRLKGIRK
ncbi:hypothetical protein CEXT_156501 [Caerostris extrusa]|uniref:Uncharacterized protein n=1 Tax=Caerostris extrusa TaxID=172846 RepID=A0AAV4TWN8_CAEEX|nr:hypothetical protein CEXT_156501 [Caerostris extrusa]